MISPRDEKPFLRMSYRDKPEQRENPDNVFEKKIDPSRGETSKETIQKIHIDLSSLKNISLSQRDGLPPLPQTPRAPIQRKDGNRHLIDETNEAPSPKTPHKTEKKTEYPPVSTPRAFKNEIDEKNRSRTSKKKEKTDKNIPSSPRSPFSFGLFSGKKQKPHGEKGPSHLPPLKAILGDKTIDGAGYVFHNALICKEDITGVLDKLFAPITTQITQKGIEGIQGFGESHKDFPFFALCSKDWPRLAFSFNALEQKEYNPKKTGKTLGDDHNIIDEIWTNTIESIKNAAPNLSPKDLKAAAFAISTLMNQKLPAGVDLYLQQTFFGFIKGGYYLTWIQKEGTNVTDTHTVYAKEGEKNHQKGSAAGGEFIFSPLQNANTLVLKLKTSLLHNTLTDDKTSHTLSSPLLDTRTLSLSLSIEGAAKIGHKLLSGEKILTEDLAGFVQDGTCLREIEGRAL